MTGWTASAAALRTIPIYEGPFFLPPGTYWVGLYNYAISGNTLGVGCRWWATLPTPTP